MSVDFPSDTRRPPSREDHYVLEDLPSRERMLYGALAYVAFPIPLFRARWDPFVRFHVRQGVGIAIGWVLGRLWARFWFDVDYELYLWLGWIGYALVTLAICDGIQRALSLRWSGPRGVGWLVNKLPLPKRLAEPRYGAANTRVDPG